MMMAALIPRGIGVGAGVGVRPLLLHPIPVPLCSPSARLPPLLSQFPSLAAPSSRRRRRRQRLRSPVVVVAAQFDFAKVVQTAYRVGRDVIETGSSFVPESVPRPVARIGVAVLAASLAIFLFKSVISTAFFVLAMMGVIYFLFVASNSDDGSKGSGSAGGRTISDEDPVEEARRIMEKYK